MDGPHRGLGPEPSREITYLGKHGGRVVVEHELCVRRRRPMLTCPRGDDASDTVSVTVSATLSQPISSLPQSSRTGLRALGLVISTAAARQPMKLRRIRSIGSARAKLPSSPLVECRLRCSPVCAPCCRRSLPRQRKLERGEDEYRCATDRSHPSWADVVARGGSQRCSCAGACGVAKRSPGGVEASSLWAFEVTMAVVALAAAMMTMAMVTM